MGPGIVCSDEAWMPPDGAGGVPPLCPRLASLVGNAGSEPSARLLRVALRVGAHELDADQFQLLFLAWGLGESLETMRRIVKAPSGDAVRHRLRRVSDAVESAIAEALCRLLSEPNRCGVHAALNGREAHPTAGLDLRASVRVALDAIASERANGRT
jgi:hypothetical protein